MNRCILDKANETANRAIKKALRIEKHLKEEQIKNGMSLGEEQQLYWNKEDYLEETPIECYVKRNGETIKFVRYEEIERLKTELRDTKEHLGEFLHEQEEEIIKLKDLIVALWHNDNARFLNKEQIDLLNKIVFGNDEDLGSDKE